MPSGLAAHTGGDQVVGADPASRTATGVVTPPRTVLDAAVPAPAPNAGERFRAAWRSPWSGLVLVGLAFCLVAVPTAWLTTPWHNNDEIDHVANIEYVRQHWRPPAIGLEHGIESHQGPLYYYGAAAWATALDLPHVDIPAVRERMFLNHTYDDTLRVLRLFSVLCGVLGVAAAYVSAWFLTRRRDVTFAAALTVGLWPKFVVVSAAVTNTVLVGSLVAAALASWAVWWRREQLAWAVGVGACLGLAALTQVTVLPVAVFMMVAMVAMRHVRPAVTAGVVAAAIGVWWFLRNAVIYGEPLATEATNDYLKGVYGGALVREPPRLDVEVLRWALPEGLRSVWWNAGWNEPELHLPFGVDVALGVAAVAAIVAAVWGRLRCRPVWMLLAVGAGAWGAWAALARTTTQAQGRYLLIGVAAWAMLLVLGSTRLRLTAWLWPVAFAVIDVYVLTEFLLTGQMSSH